MADRDPAFLWETEVLRASAPSRTAGSTRRVDAPAPTGWLTLREASEATGIPASTLRNWARKGKIPSTLEETTSGPRRMVNRHGVEARARELGHVLKTSEHRAPGLESVAAAASPPPPPPEQTSPPPGTMLVPIDAWDKMLLQLGNLHQAGQQLAEARERAARAETEAAFLRERLAEYRATGMGTETAPPPSGPAEGDPVHRDEPEPANPVKMPSFTAYLWRMAASGRRRR